LSRLDPYYCLKQRETLTSQLRKPHSSHTSAMENLKEQTDRSVEEYQEQWTLFQPDQTGYPIGQYDATASLYPFAYDALPSNVWGNDTEQPPVEQYGFGEQPYQLSLGTGYPSVYSNQYEPNFNTFQSGSGPAGIDPALLLLDHKSGLEPDHTLPPPGESFHTPRSPELHRIAEPSGPPPSKPQGKSTSGGSVAARSKLRSIRFLVKREDGKSFKVNGMPLKVATVYSLTQVGSICNCSHTKLKPALPDIEAGKAASVITKSGTWVIRIVAS
jgi:hypothetical protein